MVAQITPLTFHSFLARLMWLYWAAQKCELVNTKFAIHDSQKDKLKNGDAVPEKMVVTPQDSVSVVKLLSTGDWRAVHTRSENTQTQTHTHRHRTDKTLAGQTARCTATPAIQLRLPGVAVRCEHDGGIGGDVDDAVLRLDSHPAQLDVLRVC